MFKTNKKILQAGGAGAHWRTPPAPEVQAARDVAGSVDDGFGGGDTMRPRMRIGDTVRRMVHSQKASVDYHRGETAEEWSDPTTGASFSLGAHDVKVGASMRWKSTRPTRASSPLRRMREVNGGYGGTEAVTTW